MICLYLGVLIFEYNTVYTKMNITRPRGYKTFFMLNSTEHGISTAHRTKIPTTEEGSCFKSLRFVFIMLINVKMPTIGILTSMSRIS